MNPSSPRRLRILAVDDNPVNLRLLEVILKQAEFPHDLALSGINALELFQHREYGMVLMDLCMPEMDGYATSKVMRDMKNGKTPPIIAVSACIIDETKAQCDEAGIQDLLPKPITKRGLLAVVEKWLEPRSA